MKKKKIATIVLIIFMIGMMGACLSKSEPSNNNDSTTSESQVEDNQAIDSEEEPTEEVVPPRETSIGTSDKDIEDIKIDKIQNVRNDVTGNWRYTTTTENIDITEYALSYYKKYFKENEVHFFINFTNKTTTVINDFGYCICVSIYDYVDGEEHDAKLIARGTELGEYFIYTDNGDIEKIK